MLTLKTKNKEISHHKNGWKQKLGYDKSDNDPMLVPYYIFFSPWPFFLRCEIQEYRYK